MSASIESRLRALETNGDTYDARLRLLEEQAARVHALERRVAELERAIGELEARAIR